MGITLQGHTFTDSHGIGTPNYYGGYCHEFGATSLEALPQVWYMDRFGISNYGGYGHEFDILSARLTGATPYEFRRCNMRSC